MEPPQNREPETPESISAPQHSPEPPSSEERRRIERLYLLLPVSASVRMIGLNVLAGRRPGQEDVALLLDMVVRPKAKSFFSWANVRWLLGSTKISPEHSEREIAVWALGHLVLSPEQRAQAISGMTGILKNSRPEQSLRNASVVRGFARSYLLGASFPLLLCFLSLLFPDNRDPLSPLDFLALLLFYTGLIGSTLLSIVLPVNMAQDDKHRNALRAAAASALGRLNAIESIGTLAKTCMRSDMGLREAATHSLITLLPQLRETDYGSLPANTVPKLCALLRYQGYPTISRQHEMQLRLLWALEKIGDGQALTTVKQIADKAPGREVRETAARLLPVLISRQMAENNRSMLLRPSENIHAPETLLRPVITAPDTTPPEELLRPHQSE